MLYEYTKTQLPCLCYIHDEVEASAMTDKSIEWCNWEESEQKLKVNFTNTLSTGDETILDDIVVACPVETNDYPNPTHIQNTDTKLDEGGDNEVVVADIKDAVDKKHNSVIVGTKEVDETAIGDGKVVRYNSASEKLEYVLAVGPTGSQGPTGSLGTSSIVQLHRSADLTADNTWQDVEFDVIDIENDTDTLERDDVNTDRILVKQDGYYLINYNFSTWTSNGVANEVRVRVNDTTILPSSYQQSLCTITDAENSVPLTNSLSVSLSNGNYITLQIKASNGCKQQDVNFSIAKLVGSDIIGPQGVTGPTGPQGPTGSSEAVFGTEYENAENEGESSTTNTTFQQKLRLTTVSLPAGTYQIGWSCEAKPDDGEQRIAGTQVQVDDTTTLCYSEIAGNVPYPGEIPYGFWTTVSGFKVIELEAGSHNIDVDFKRAGSSGTSYIKRVRLTIWRVS